MRHAACLIAVVLAGCGALRTANPAYFAAGAAAVAGAQTAVDPTTQRAESNDPWRARPAAPPPDANPTVPESAFDVVDGVTPPP